MSADEWWRVLAVAGILAAGLPVVRRATLRTGTPPEVARKAVHVAMGLGCAAFPWVFDRPQPVWVLAGLATGMLVLLRVMPRLRSGIGAPLHGVGRFSYGELLFAPAVAAVFHGAGGDPLLHVIPIGILTVSDAAGALAGTRWGRRRYGCGEGFKTVEGSLVFLLSAFLCVLVPLLLADAAEPARAVAIALILATLAMMAEGMADRGFDNLVVPLGCFFVLDRLMPLEMAGLAGRLIALAVLLATVLAGARWSTLNGASLLGAALLGYGCAVIADWRFALPPLALFVCHLVTTRRHRLTIVIDHRMDAVLSHAIGCMPWVLLVEVGRVAAPAGLAGVSFAMAAQLAMLDDETKRWLGRTGRPAIAAVAKGWVVAGLPGLIWLGRDALAWPVALACIGSFAAVALARMAHAAFHERVTLWWILRGSFALAASAPALFFRS